MHDRIAWTLAACARIMRPMVRLALAFGAKHPQLEALLRDLLLDEARRQLLAGGVSKPNISQLAVATGINRKDVTARVRVAESPLPSRAISPATQVYTAWLQLVSRDAAKQNLPIRLSAHGDSFESLARDASKGNLHHRTVLDELVRLGMVTEHDETVALNPDGFVPAQDLEAMLEFLGGNTADHLHAAVSNTLGHTPRLLERAVFADGLTVADCARLHATLHQRWESIHHEMVDEMSAAVDHAGAAGNQRMKVGIYVYYEDSESPESPASQESGNASKKGRRP